MELSTKSLTVKPGSQGTVTLTAQAMGGQFGLPVTLSCSGLPTGATCSFNPAVLTPNFTPTSSVLTISVPKSSVAAPAPSSRSTSPLFALWLAPFGIVATSPSARRRLATWLLLGILVLGLVLILQACGGGGGSSLTGRIGHARRRNNGSVNSNLQRYR